MGVFADFMEKLKNGLLLVVKDGGFLLPTRPPLPAVNWNYGWDYVFWLFVKRMIQAPQFIHANRQQIAKGFCIYPPCG